MLHHLYVQLQMLERTWANNESTMYSWSLRSSVVFYICCGQDDRVIGVQFPASTETFLHIFRTDCVAHSAHYPMCRHTKPFLPRGKTTVAWSWPQTAFRLPD